MIQAKSYAAHEAKSSLKPYTVERRDVGARDVLIKIAYCGICHSDIHKVNDEWDWNPGSYPLVPGHEIVGTVTDIGSDVTNFKIGDCVGVGCMVDACHSCHTCKNHEEQYCANSVYTYNSPDPKSDGLKDAHTQGGYSECVVVDEQSVLHIPKNLELSGVAPLLCAGITTYAPLKRWNVRTGTKVGVIGLGGLGHMAIKIAKAMGAEITLFTTSENKKADALRLGAHRVVLSTNDEEMNAQAYQLDLILDLVSAEHDINRYLATLRLDGVMVLVGAPEKPFSLNVASLMVPRRTLTTSLIGGISETQEMLDFCSKHNIISDVEVIAMSQVNEAYTRVLKQDVKYRFVIDMQSL